MREEPLYGLPVEEPGDIEGWSINTGQPGTLLAEAIAAELDRIEDQVAALQAAVSGLPRTIQAGTLGFPRSVFVEATNPLFNGTFYRGSQAIPFPVAFEDPPAVVALANSTVLAGEVIEVTVSNVTPQSFTLRVATTVLFPSGLPMRWIAMSRTQ